MYTQVDEFLDNSKVRWKRWEQQIGWGFWEGVLYNLQYELYYAGPDKRSFVLAKIKNAVKLLERTM